MKVPKALGMGAIGLLDKDSAISKMFGLGGDDAAKAKAAAEEEEKKKKAEAAPAGTAGAPTGITAPPAAGPVMKRGGKVKHMAKGGSASSRADGCVQRGRTKGIFV